MPRDPLKLGSMSVDVIVSPKLRLIPKELGWVIDDAKVEQQLRMDMDKVIKMGDTEWFIMWKEPFPVHDLGSHAEPFPSYAVSQVLHATGYYDNLVSKMYTLNMLCERKDAVFVIFVVSPLDIRRYVFHTPDEWWHAETYQQEMRKRYGNQD